MDRELESLIERRVEERLEERLSEREGDLLALRREKDESDRQRDRALALLVESGITPVLRVNVLNAEPLYVLVRLDGSEADRMFPDALEAVTALLVEKKKAVEAGGRGSA